MSKRGKWGDFIGLFIVWCGSALFCGLKNSFSAWFLFYSLGFILVFSLSVPLLCLRRISVSRHIPADSFFAGDDIAVSVELNHHSLLPLPWLQVRESWTNETLEQTLVVDKLVFPWFQSSISYQYSLTNVQRGYYRMHSLELIIGNVFGFMPLHRQIEVKGELAVYPLSFIPEHGFAGYDNPGENQLSQRVSNGKQSLSGLVRDYANGDPLNRIHWKSTARTGSLKTKEMENDHATRKMLFLDVGKLSSSAEEAENFEFRIQLAAGWMRHNQEYGFPIGLTSSIDTQSLLIPVSKPFDCLKGYEFLAKLRPVEPSSYPELLSLHAVKQARNVTLVCITSNLCESLILTLKALRIQNHPIQLMIVGAESIFSPQYRECKSYLAGIGVEVLEFRVQSTNREVSAHVHDASA